MYTHKRISLAVEDTFQKYRAAPYVKLFKFIIDIIIKIKFVHYTR